MLESESDNVDAVVAMKALEVHECLQSLWCTIFPRQVPCEAGA